MMIAHIHAVQFPQRFDLILNVQLSLLIDEFHDRK
jgi:hypothetical protein